MEKANLLQYTFLTGFILGGFTASQRASLQFLAEHQHERLSKRSEFVAFHRARNYRLMAAFGQGGMRRGVQLAAVAAAYLTAKDGVALLRQKFEFSFRIPRFLDNIAVCSLLGASAFAIGTLPPHEHPDLTYVATPQRWLSSKHMSEQARFLVLVESINVNYLTAASEPGRLNLKTSSSTAASLKLPVDCTQIQFQVDFQVVPSANAASMPEEEVINLMFHEMVIKEEEPEASSNEGEECVLNMFVENMGRFGITALDECYRYLVTPMTSIEDFAWQKGLLCKLQLCSNDCSVWFVAEWPIEWTQKTETPAPTQLSPSKHLSVESIEESFENVSFSDFLSESASPKASASSAELREELPPSPIRSSSASGRIVLEASLPPTRRSSPLQRAENDDEGSDDSVDEDELGTVDILHQVGSLLISSSFGQFVTRSLTRSDPKVRHLKLAYSTAPLWLLGVEYQLQSIGGQEQTFKSSASASAASLPTSPSGLSQTHLARSNHFALMVGRSPVEMSRNSVLFRQILLTKQAGPSVPEKVKAFLPDWPVLKQNSAMLVLSAPSQPGLQVQFRVFSLTPTAQSPPDTPELFLVDFQVTLPLPLARFESVAQVGAIFVELSGFLVRLEQSLTSTPPEIVILQTANAHFYNGSLLSQPVMIPAVRISPIPVISELVGSVYLWSDHLQGWILQTIRFSPSGGMTLHPLIDEKSKITVQLLNSQLKVSCNLEKTIFAFSVSTSDSDTFHFRCSEAELKELIGRIRFLSRQTRRSSPKSPNRPASPIAAQNQLVMQGFFGDFQSRFWFTYRKGFPRIEPSLFTTDTGWGCMLRTGQSLMAEALARYYFGRNWRLWQLSRDTDSSRMALLRQLHSQIIQEFADLPLEECPQARFSVHEMAQEGAKIGTPIGQWFGPSVLSKVLKNICNSLNDSPLWIYSSQDGLISTGHLLKIVERRTLLLLLPLRLGLQEVNSLYADFIAGCLQSPSSVGIVGGTPGRSLYFVGCQESELLFLDPHILRPTPFSPDASTVPDLVNEFHTDMVRSIPIKEMDPSMMFGFVCGSKEEVERMMEQLEVLNRAASILNIQ